MEIMTLDRANYRLDAAKGGEIRGDAKKMVKVLA